MFEKFFSDNSVNCLTVALQSLYGRGELQHELQPTQWIKNISCGVAATRHGPCRSCPPLDSHSHSRLRSVVSSYSRVGLRRAKAPLLFENWPRGSALHAC